MELKILFLLYNLKEYNHQIYLYIPNKIHVLERIKRKKEIELHINIA